jgi:hypothetical protein
MESSPVQDASNVTMDTISTTALCAISLVFGILERSRYFGHLLKSDTIFQTHSPVFSDGRQGALMVEGHAAPYLAACYCFINGLPVLVIDWGVDIIARGPVISQTLWRPFTQESFRQNVLEAPLEMPIFFVQRNGSLGFTVEQGLSGNLSTFHGLNEVARLGGQTSKHFRIVVRTSSIITTRTSTEVIPTLVARPSAVEKTVPDAQ